MRQSNSYSPKTMGPQDLASDGKLYSGTNSWTVPRGTYYTPREYIAFVDRQLRLLTKNSPPAFLPLIDQYLLMRHFEHAVETRFKLQEWIGGFFPGSRLNSARSRPVQKT